MFKDVLVFPESERPFLEPYLQPHNVKIKNASLPFVTLTFATSLDSSLSIASGARTWADNPGLNCQIEGVGRYGGGDKNLQGQPRPIIIDPTARWDLTEEAQIFQLNPSPPTKQKQIHEEHGGKFVTLNITTPEGETSHDLVWTAVLETLKKEGLNSVMIEGGSGVINTLLEPSSQALIDNMIITITPT
ncbi:RibD family protein [Aspergillus glaucus CBS 516.65]|uniref:2,5-diamino-6-ribosylamino-4(3H)-pyrimidinone 5'-phosphate reductase n=1 Tax=Aspergillus glaucus CBS 516.65 TaxID=1160497 RepID=A0A1L9V5N0_ASPGL|nr:hypothetical protein ASPGLDRAFT_77773 [Aspergillus glaucus CBS 516.65]OJJ79152.1 hypothetical protein ASPGLDRAFT_77773 [Aspergillus glaucus CBS 516.65]